jgi:hypothetical protein
MISNLSPIKDLLLLHLYVDIVCKMAKVFRLLLLEPHIIAHLPLIKETFMINSMMGFSEAMTITVSST